MGKSEDRKPFPGLTYTRFKAAVEAVVALRDSAKLIVFLSRRQSVRLIGRDEDLQRAFAEKLGVESTEKKETREAFEEVRNFLATRIDLAGVERTVDLLERQVYDDEFEALNEEEREEFRKLLENKARLVDRKLFTDALGQRDERLSTAIGACLEDVDIEVVRSRKDQFSGREVVAPFLRLRVRYADEATSWFPFRFWGFPWGRSLPRTPTNGFELECDELDVDLLMERLREAKQLLMKSMEPTAEV